MQNSPLLFRDKLFDHESIKSPKNAISYFTLELMARGVTTIAQFGEVFGVGHLYMVGEALAKWK
jgi:hypothetical protein